LNREEFTQWIKQIFRTDEAEIGCDGLQQALPAFVDAEVERKLGGAEPAAFAAIRTHLYQCPDCNDIYENLRQIAILSDSGRLPEVEEALETIVASDEPAQPAAAGSERMTHALS
jgi:hypothetical protein